MFRHGPKLLALLSASIAMAFVQVPALRITFTLPVTHAFWMAIPADIDGDANEEIVITTMDPNKVQELTPPTPVYILGVSNGVVSDRSTELFAGTAPTAYSGKPTAGDFDADGRTDLAICDKGRDIGTSLAPGSVFTPGVRGGANTALVQRDGKLVAQTFPDAVAGHWGCSAGDIDRSGRAALVVNAFIRPAGYPNTYLVQWDGNKFIKTKDLTAPPASGVGYFWTSTADFDLDGYADVAGRTEVWWRVGTDQSRVRPLAESQIGKAGYTFIRGTLAVDFTGDGYPDLMRIATGANEFQTGDARFMMYVSDRQGGLVERRMPSPRSPPTREMISARAQSRSTSTSTAPSISSRSGRSLPALPPCPQNRRRRCGSTMARAGLRWRVLATPRWRGPSRRLPARVLAPKRSS